MGCLVVLASGCGEYVTNTSGGVTFNRNNGEVTLTIPGSRLVEGSGRAAEEKRTVGAFERVYVDHGIEATFEEGDAGELTVEADDNLLPLVQTQVDDGMLRVRLVGSLKTRTPIRVRGQAGELREAIVVCSATLTAPKLDGSYVNVETSSDGQATLGEIRGDDIHISATSSGEVQAPSIVGKRLEVSVNSAGRVAAVGEVDQQQVQASSSGAYAGSELTSRVTQVEANSAGSADVRATEEVTGVASSAGQIRYFGKPAKAAVQTSSAGSASAG